MAVKIAFKVPCPSCEAPVPVKDKAYVGRKIDCPKCKYRFVVEEPEDEVEEDDDEEAASTKRNGKSKKGANGKAPKGKKKTGNDKPKAKKKGNPTLLIGGIVGAIAVAGLVVGGLYVFGVFGGSKPTPPANAGTGTPGTGTPGTGTPGTETPGTGTPGTGTPGTETPGTGTPVKPPPPVVLVANLTNYLPNDTEAVVSLNVDGILRSSARRAAVEAGGSFSAAAFARVFGFPLEAETQGDKFVGQGITRAILALNPTKDWVFSIVRAAKPLDQAALAEKLKLQEQKTSNNLTYHIVKADLDGLGNLFAKAGQPRDEVSVHFLDPQTMVFADTPKMKEFLEKDNAKPRWLSEDKPTGPGGPPTGPPTGPPPPPFTLPGAGQQPPVDQPAPGRAGGDFQPMKTGAQPPETKEGDGQPPPDQPGTGQPGTGQPGTGMPPTPPAPTPSGNWMSINKTLKSILDATEKEAKDTLFEIAFDAHLFFAGEIGRQMKEQLALRFGEAEAEKLFKQQQLLAKAATMGLTLHAFHDQSSKLVVAVKAPSEAEAKAAEKEFKPALAFVPLLFKFYLNMEVGAPGATPPVMIDPETGLPIPQPGVGLPGGGFGGQPGGGFGGQPPFGGQPDPNNPGGEPQPPPKPKNGTVELKAEGDVLTLELDLVPTDRLKGMIRDVLSGIVVLVRSEAEMATTRSRVHELARATQKHLEAKGKYPRGTASRSLDVQRVLDWPPNQRVSWMAELLPFLGDGEYRGLGKDVQMNKSWDDDENLLPAHAVIPQFVARTSRDVRYRVLYTDRPWMYGTTHYVGIAGVGLDAADYPATEKKRGVFGYDRQTAKADVKDGLDKTILLLQIPSHQKTPWLAGGGATIRGVAEDDSALEPFVCVEFVNPSSGKKEKGTFAVMCDGKVRFLPEKLDPNVFRSLCTIDGGEKIDLLDKLCPEVTEEATSTLSTIPIPVSKPPVGGTVDPIPNPKPPVDPTPTPKPPEKPAIPADWKEIKSKEGGFSVMAPAGKKIDVSGPNPAFNNIVFSTVGVELGTTKGNGMTVTYVDLPEALFDGMGTEKNAKAFTAARAYLKTFVGDKGKIVKDDKLKVGPHEAQEIHVDFPNKSHSRFRVVLVDKRAYVLRATGSADVISEMDAAAFFESFKLTQATPAPGGGGIVPPGGGIVPPGGGIGGGIVPPGGGIVPPVPPGPGGRPTPGGGIGGGVVPAPGPGGGIIPPGPGGRPAPGGAGGGTVTPAPGGGPRPDVPPPPPAPAPRVGGATGIALPG